MTPVAKALWFIEAHFREPISLDDAAEAAGVSRHHLARAFAALNGRSVMRHVRARRLTEAALRLAQGAPDILQVALDAGYASHEAFTRAFREQFAATPEAIRAGGSTQHLNLSEHIPMPSHPHPELASPRFEQGRAMLITGLMSRHEGANRPSIPDQWGQFAPMIPLIAHQTGDHQYGVMRLNEPEGTVDYLAGVEVTRADDLPAGLTTLRLEPQTYAVFHHDGHVSEARAVCAAIWEVWFPQSGREPAAAPDFERYGPEFDVMTGRGGFEVWISLKA